MEDMRERKDTFEMPEIPNVAIPPLREGTGLTNGVTMREGGGRVKRGSIKRQSEILREKRQSRQEEREEERKRKESYFRKVTGYIFIFYYSVFPVSSRNLVLCFRSEESQGASDGLLLRRILKMLQDREVLRPRGSACGR